MRRMIALVCALGLTVPLAAAAPSAGRHNKGTVSVKVTDLRNAKGVVRACMTANPEKFPRCRGDANSHRVVVAAAESLSLTFTGVAPGRYAIALLHDENGNGKADRALTMIPKEGFGFSRDAKVRMGPPKFSEAAFEFEGSQSEHTIRMRYML